MTVSGVATIPLTDGGKQIDNKIFGSEGIKITWIFVAFSIFMLMILDML